MISTVRALRDEAVFQVKRPYRFWRRLTVGWRGWPKLPGGRDWRSLISPRLHIEFMRGYLNRGYTWRGVPMWKHPVDIALYLLLLQEVRPKTIIEIGSKYGGSAIWLNEMCNALGLVTDVFSIDLHPPDVRARALLYFLKGDENELDKVDLKWHQLPHPWLVIQDASHQFKPLLRSMMFLANHMITGDRLIVEDGFITELGVDAGRQGGPARAIAEFLANHKDWQIDTRYCDFYGKNVTGNPNGYLVKT